MQCSRFYNFTICLSLCLQDGHEICFVGDEAFRELSQPDPEGDKLLNEVCMTNFISDK